MCVSTYVGAMPLLINCSLMRDRAPVSNLHLDTINQHSLSMTLQAGTRSLPLLAFFPSLCLHALCFLIRSSFCHLQHHWNTCMCFSLLFYRQRRLVFLLQDITVSKDMIILGCDVLVLQTSKTDDASRFNFRYRLITLAFKNLGT